MAFNKGDERFINDALYVAVSDVPDAPNISISLSTPELVTNDSPISITTTFTRPVTGFDVADLNLTNCTLDAISGSGEDYVVTVIPTAEGVVSVQVLGAGISDADVNVDSPVDDSNTLDITYDVDPPIALITSTADDPTDVSPIPILINFEEVSSGLDEDVTGFTVDDITVVNGTLSNFTQVDGNTYTVDVTPTANDVLVSVSVGSGVCQDAAGNNNNASQTFEITYDTDVDVTSPTPVLTSGSAATTNDNPILVSIDFGEVVTGFTVGDLSLGNCSAQNFVNTNGQVYTVELVPSSQGQITTSVPQGVCQDGNANANNASTQFSRTFDSLSPAPVITSSESSPTSASPIPISVDFGEVVSGFVVGDIQVGNGTVSNFTNVDDEVYTFDVTPDSNQEDITVDIPGDVAVDVAGNPNTAATQFEITHDTTGPVPTISSGEPNPTSTSPIPITIQFDEDVTGFVLGDVTVGNGTGSNFVAVDANTYTLDVTPDGDPETVTVDVDAGVCQDGLGNTNQAATQFEITYDTQIPLPVITSTESSPTNQNPIPISVDFGEVVTGFVSGEVTIANGTISNFVNVDGQVYTFDVIPDSNQENITIDIAQGVASDSSGNPNDAATQFAITFDATGPIPTISSSETGPTDVSPIPVTVQFNEVVTGFVVGDLIIGNGSAGNFVAVDGDTYTFDLTPTGPGTCTVDVNPGVCQDSSGNGNVGATQFSIAYDNVAPTVSNDTLSYTSPTTDGFTLNWIKASDNITLQGNITYRVFISLSANIDTVGNIIANGTEVHSQDDINNRAITGQTQGDEVWTNLIAEDEAGNQLAYAMNSTVITDSTPPNVPNPGLSVKEKYPYSLVIEFVKASDLVSDEADLVYELYISDQDNMNSVADCKNNGTKKSEGTDVTELPAYGLNEYTNYYYQVLVKDEQDNEVIYTANFDRTSPIGDATLELMTI